MWTTYWWIITDEESELCGEEFFTELENADAAAHRAYVKKLFPNVDIRGFGKVSKTLAERMGLDTY